MSTWNSAYEKETKYTTTENGAKSLATTQPDEWKEKVNGRVSMFFKPIRGVDVQSLETFLSESWQENKLHTLKLVFYLRDCRGGKGERDLFYNCCKWFKKSGKQKYLDCNVEHIPFYGRWSDLLHTGDVGFKLMARQIIDDYLKLKNKSIGSEFVLVKNCEETKDQANHKSEEIKNESGLKEDSKTESKKVVISLASKWAPRQPKTNKVKSKKDKVWKKIKKLILFMNEYVCEKKVKVFNKTKVSICEYRKMISACTKHIGVVETLMSSKQFDKIDFNTVPSCAMHLYGKNHIKGGKEGSFKRRLPEKFEQYKSNLKRRVDDDGKVVKINASQLFPHQLVMEYLSHGKNHSDIVQAQWDELIKKSKRDGKFSALCCPDVSGSMNCQVTGDSSVKALDISVTLGVFCAEVSEGPFHNMLITFSTDPKVHRLNDNMNLHDKVESVTEMDWCMSTNLQSVFDLILDVGVKHNVPEEEMPKMVIIPSDMQFDNAVENNTNMEVIDEKYKKAGYKRPVVVFWNLANKNTGDFPVSASDDGTVLISGFSQSILKSLIDCPDDVTPWGIIKKTVFDNPRYEKITLPKN